MNAEIDYFCTVETQEIITNLGEGIPIKDSFNIIFWLLMSSNLVIIAFSKTRNPGYLITLLKAALTNRQLKHNLKEDLDLWKLSSLLLNLAYFNCIGVIIWMVSRTAENLWMLYITFFLLGLSLIKLISIRVISFLIGSKIGIEEHFQNHFVFYQLGAVILTPVLIFTHYVPASYTQTVQLIIISIAGFLILVREIQSLTQAIQYKISIFYIILYLCTLELIPLVVGVRVFILNSGAFN